MNGIEQSPILLALGYAIGHSIWQLSVLWFLYFLANYFGNLSSSQRFIWSAFSVIGGMIWFLATWVYYLNNLKFVNIGNSLSLVNTETTGNSFAFYFQTLIATLNGLSPYLSCAYLLVVSVLCIRLMNGFRQVNQLRSRQISKASAELRLFVSYHAQLLGISKQVRIYISKIATSPITVGFFKPIILLPVASLNQLSIQQTEAILLHELAHIRRNDYLFNILLLMAEISLFFNPFMRLLMKQCRLERENSCDDFVLQFKYCPNDYAKALFSLEQESMRTLLALGSNNNNQFQLLNRIKRLVAPERHSFNYKQQLGLLALVTLISVCFAALRPSKQHQMAAKQTNPTKIPENFKINITAPFNRGINLVSVLQNAPLHAVLKVEETWNTKKPQKEKIITPKKLVLAPALTIASNQKNIEVEQITHNLYFEAPPQIQTAQSPSNNPSWVWLTLDNQNINSKIQNELNADQQQIMDFTQTLKVADQPNFMPTEPNTFTYDYTNLPRQVTINNIKKERKKPLKEIKGPAIARIQIAKRKEEAALINSSTTNKTIIVSPLEISATNPYLVAESAIEIYPEINTETLEALEEKISDLELGLMIILTNKAIITTKKAFEKVVNANINYSITQMEKSSEEIKRIQEVAHRYIELGKIIKTKLKRQHDIEKLDLNIEINNNQLEKQPRKITYHYKTSSL